MSTAPNSPSIATPRVSTLAELVHELGDVPLDRIVAKPPPGKATEKDLLRYDKDNVTCELIDGVLVVKTMGMRQAVIAVILAKWIDTYLDANPLGACAGADNICKLLPGLVRSPDVSFISRAQLAKDKEKDFTFAICAPELCVEVWSKGNTRKEIDRKIKEYFQNGARLVWEIFPKKRSATIYHSPLDSAPISAAEFIDGEDVLPGFRFLLGDLFTAADKKLEGFPIHDEDDDESLE